MGMRFAAAFLLVIAFALDMLAGGRAVVLSLMDSDFLTLMNGVGGEYGALLKTELDASLAGIIAIENALVPLLANLTPLGESISEMVSITGALMASAGLLALAAAVQLLRGRPGIIIYVGCVAAIIADAAPLALLPFSYVYLPGFLAGLVGIVAAQGLRGNVISKPAAVPAKPAKPAKPAEAAKAETPPEPEIIPELEDTFGLEDTGSGTKIRSTVKTADDFTPKRRRRKLNVRQLAIAASVAVVVIVGGVAGYLMVPKFFGPGSGKAPVQTASAPTPGEKSAQSGTQTAEAPAPVVVPEPEPERKIPKEPVKGELAGKPFKPKRVALKVATWSTTKTGGGSNSTQVERLSLVLEGGDDLQIEIQDLPRGYNFSKGLKISVDPDKYKPDQPRLKLMTPQSGGHFPKTEIIPDGFELELKLNRLRGNQVSGEIFLALPERAKTQVAGRFKAWVDGHPEIEPDLTRGGSQTFRYLTFQYLKEIHPGAVISIKDDSYAHQVGDVSRNLTGHIQVVYTVNGQEKASILRMETSAGYWRVLDSLDATYLPDAHPIEIPSPKNVGQWVNYLAATHTEEWFREQYPGKVPWSATFTGTSNTTVGFAEVHLRLKPYGEPDSIQRRYYFLRTDGRWRYIRDLKESEEIDQTTGKVVKKTAKQKAEANQSS